MSNDDDEYVDYAALMRGYDQGTFRQGDEDEEYWEDDRAEYWEDEEEQSLFSRVPTPVLAVVSILVIAGGSWVLFLRDSLQKDAATTTTLVPGLPPGISEATGTGATGSTVAEADVFISAVTQAAADWSRFGQTGDLNTVRGSFLEAGRSFARFTAEAPGLRQNPSNFTLGITNPTVVVEGDERILRANVTITVGDQIQQDRWEFVMAKNPRGEWVVEQVRAVKD